MENWFKVQRKVEKKENAIGKRRDFLFVGSVKLISYFVFIALFCFSLLYSCTPKKSPSSLHLPDSDSSIRYAQGFSVRVFDNYKLVDIQYPTGESEVTYHYALLERGADKKTIPTDYELIEVPVKSVICMTTLQLSNFIKLDAVDRIVGMPSTRFLFNAQMKQQLKEGTTKRIGIEGEFDTELVLALNPDVILVSPFKRGGYDAIRNLKIPLISFLGYKEISPLGQAEWIKFTGMLLGLEEQANAQFEAIENEYNRLKKLAESVVEKPVVLSGELHSGNWYVVGGKSYLAHLFVDAGAKYFMPENNESGGFYVDFETVYSQGATADYWRMVNSYKGEFSYEVLRKTDARYTDFRAFREKNLIYCNLREKPFYEQTPVEPEVVLADLIKIFHPDLLPEHKPVYYELLNR